MTTTGPAVTIREALLPGDPVSHDEAVALTGAARQNVVSALSHLVGRGDLERVRRRLWVRHGAPPDPHRLAARIAAPSAFAYGSALALHGAGPSERSELLVFSPHRFTNFAFSGMHYRWARPWIDDGLVSVTVGAEFVRVTSAERTLVDCVRVPANAGGVEELSRAVDMLPSLDGVEVVRWVDYYAEAVLPARLGFLIPTTGKIASRRLPDVHSVVLTICRTSHLSDSDPPSRGTPYPSADSATACPPSSDRPADQIGAHGAAPALELHQLRRHHVLACRRSLRGGLVR